MCALAEGRSVESTMGFTALDGLPMGTRPGQIDPGVVLYLIAEKGMTPAAVQDLLYRESGLKGLSGISNDMRELQSSGEPRAKLAVDYFIYRLGYTPECWPPRSAGSTLSFSPPVLANGRRSYAPALPRAWRGSASFSIRPPMKRENR
jgi:hypothetical protein